MQHTHTHTYTPNDDRRAKVLYRSVVVVAQLAQASPSPRKAEKGTERAVLLWHPASPGSSTSKKKRGAGTPIVTHTARVGIHSVAATWRNCCRWCAQAYCTSSRHEQLSPRPAKRFPRKKKTVEFTPTSEPETSARKTDYPKSGGGDNARTAELALLTTRDQHLLTNIRVENDSNTNRCSHVFSTNMYRIPPRRRRAKPESRQSQCGP